MSEPFEGFTSRRNRLGSRGWCTQIISGLLHVVFVGGVIITSLIATGIMPTPLSAMKKYVRTDVVLPAEPPRIENSFKNAGKGAQNPARPSVPTKAPDKILPEPERPYVPGPIGPGDDLGDRGLPIGHPGPLPEPPSPPPPPPPQKPLQIGGDITAPKKIVHVAPVYPQIAQSARVSGIVIIEATIGIDGRVINAKVLKPVPLLDQAALDAVRQWRFTPTMLNGVPHQVIMTVTVNFTMQ